MLSVLSNVLYDRAIYFMMFFTLSFLATAEVAVERSHDNYLGGFYTIPKELYVDYEPLWPGTGVAHFCSMDSQIYKGFKGNYPMYDCMGYHYEADEIWCDTSNECHTSAGKINFPGSIDFDRYYLIPKNFHLSAIGGLPIAVNSEAFSWYAKYQAVFEGDLKIPVD